MIEILKSIFLGLVQGLTEFLPISSSGHLNIFPWLFGWEITESFDLALHAGTLLAILVYFFKDWINLIVGGYKAVVKKEKSADGRLFWFLVIATIPAGAVGKVLENLFEKAVKPGTDLEMIFISAALIILGVILYIVDNHAKSTVSLEKMNFKQSFVIGMSQAVAGMLPGVSRSGITMTTARAYGLDRDSAAKYSFLLSAPMVAGAIVMSLKDFSFNSSFFIGIITSFISGLFVIKFLMNYLKKGGFGVFAIYRVVFGLFILITAFIRMA